MPKEQFPLSGSPESVFGLSQEKFSQVCDSLVDYQIPPQLFTDINETIGNNRLVVFVLTHQSYFDVEIYRHLCEQTNQTSEKPIESYLIFSSPAVGLNIGGLLKSRYQVYKKCHLNMLGVVRSSDYSDQRYKNSITPKLESESSDNSDLYGQKTRQGGCISFIPFEATLKSGRINPETNTIYGMQEINSNPLLVSAIKQRALIIPCGIDGSYKIVDPVEHKLSDSFKEAVFVRSPQKIVTLKVGQPIDLSFPEYNNAKTRDLYHHITFKVAELMPPSARGEYGKYFQP